MKDILNWRGQGHVTHIKFLELQSYL